MYKERNPYENRFMKDVNMFGKNLCPGIVGINKKRSCFDECENSSVFLTIGLISMRFGVIA